jgi:PAS domain S-box-containing protein
MVSTTAGSSGRVQRPEGGAHPAGRIRRAPPLSVAPAPRLRLWPFLTAGLLTLFLALSIRLSASLRDALEDELTSRLRIAAKLVLTFLEHSVSSRLSPSDFELQSRVNEIREATRVSEIVLYDGRGQLLGGVPRSPAVPRQIRLGTRSGALEIADPTFRDPDRDSSGGLTLVVSISVPHDIGAILVRIDREGIRELAAVDLLFELGKLSAGIAFAVLLLIMLRWGARGTPEAPARGAPAVASSDVDIVLDTMKEVVTSLKDSESEYRDLWTAAASTAERYRATNDLILSSITSGLVAFDSEGRVTMFNPAAERILQVMPGEQLLGRTVAELFGEDDRLTFLARQLLKDKRGTSRVEIERSSESGEAVWIGISSSVIRENRGLLVGGIFLIADITETRRLREAMNLKDRLAAVGEMSAGIAHEVKNSAHSLLGLANLLREDFGDRELPLPVRGILSEVESLRMLVQGILEFSGGSSLLKEPASLNDIVRETVEAVAEAARAGGVSIECELAEGLPRVLVDFQALKRAFLNLALNAIQAMEKQGKLTIRTRLAEPLEGEDASSARWVRIGFHDTGPGIPEADRRRIFTPFYTTKREGSGLGLALVHRTITDHDGRIRLHSRIGVGTEFVIHLPAEP